MPAPPPDARAHRGRVVRVEAVGSDGAIVVVRPEHDLGTVRASRFFMLKCTDGTSPFLPRPFSIYRQRDGNLEFLLKVIGAGTAALAEARPGQEVILNGPLGNGWPTLDGDGPPWVFLAGGVGSAPFFMGAEQALAGMDGASPVRPEDVSLLFGAATREYLYDFESFVALGIRAHSATDDGSAGFHGNVLELLSSLQASGELPAEVRLLACGPERMLEAVEALADERGYDAWLSLETPMACGVGICNGCPVPTRTDGPMGSWPNVKCCVEGPVFKTDTITLR